MTSELIRKVAVVGASGNTGRAIVDALLSRGFVVTAVTRASTNATFPAAVSIKTADLEVKDSLYSAFRGQDAVVSAIAKQALDSETTLIDAAVEAKVKRFIPSYFGFNSSASRDSRLRKAVEAKMKSQEYLVQLSQNYDWFSWTSLATGLYFDLNLKIGVLGFDLSTKTATIVDSGDQSWSATNVGTIGEAIASILSRPHDTANKILNISSFTTSQNEVLRLLESESGQKWQVTYLRSTDLEDLSLEKEREGNPWFFVFLLQRHSFSDGANASLREEDSANSFLGLQKEDIGSTVRKALGL